jgi:hypothetical protein
MNSKSELEGGSGNGASIVPVEPASPNVLPNSPKESGKPTEDGDERLNEEDLRDGTVNNSVSDNKV